MNFIFMMIFAGIVLTAVFKVAHLLYLLFKLGFNLEVLKFMAILGLVTTFAAFILIGTNYSTAGFILFSIVGVAMLFSLFNMTKMKPKSHYGNKKPITISDSKYAWSYYGFGNGDCGNIGVTIGSTSYSDSVGSDWSADCGGGGGE